MIEGRGEAAQLALSAALAARACLTAAVKLAEADEPQAVVAPTLGRPQVASNTQAQLDLCGLQLVLVAGDQRAPLEVSDGKGSGRKPLKLKQAPARALLAAARREPCKESPSAVSRARTALRLAGKKVGLKEVNLVSKPAGLSVVGADLSSSPALLRNLLEGGAA